MKNWNLRRPWCRALSVIMTMALTISLLSGCGQQTSTDTVPREVSDELQEDIVSVTGKLASQSELIDASVEQLAEEVDNRSDSMGETLTLLEEQLETLSQDTEDLMSTKEQITACLSEEAEKLYLQRDDEWNKKLAEKKEQAETLLSDIKTAYEGGDFEKAKEQTDTLKQLLVAEEEPKTYGTSLPNEAGTEEPDEIELDQVPEPLDVEPMELTEEELSSLLVTEDDTALCEELKTLADELGTPLSVYNYLKNNIGYEYYYGSRKGASGTLAALGGNDMDQASLLIAMLRYLGYEAEYVRGNIYLTPEQAMSLTGADTVEHGADILAAAGVPTGKIRIGDEIQYIQLEHVWVRALIPYTQYRGAGEAAGDKVWIDLDTGIKAYEAVDNIYDVMEGYGAGEQIKAVIDSGDTSGIEELMGQWEEQLSKEDADSLYARKRIIKQETCTYLPNSLQYTVVKELETFSKVPEEDRDTISFQVGGETLGTYASAMLAGKNILLSYQPVTDADAEIIGAYPTIFDVPAHTVYLKPVLQVDGETVAEGTGTTLGTASDFTMQLHSGNKDTLVENEVTTGSMYAVTLDSQNITSGELQDIYDEVTALKDSVTEENVYSEAYLGKLLNLAGKLYFAQVDIADTIAAEMYDVAHIRSLSEGITGYEVEPVSLYGLVTGISEGSLFIDVDADIHSVVNFNGDTDIPKEYMMSTGMISSLYESTVWEEITGEESVSTISILSKASEENIDILLLSKANLSAEIEKLHTDETTKQSIINAVNSGMVVTVPAEDVTIGDWSGTGYIVTNPETGTGAYMISGGLNGGSVPIKVNIAYIVDVIFCIVDLAEAITIINGAIGTIGAAVALGSTVLGVVGLIFGAALAIFAVVNLIRTISLMCRYVSGDVEAGKELTSDAWVNAIVGIITIIGGPVLKKALKSSLENGLIRKYGTEFFEKMLKEFDDVNALSKCVKQLEKQGLCVGVILETAEKYGKEGLEWLVSKSKLGLTDDLVRQLLKVDDLSLLSDDVIKAIKNSNGYADEIIDYLIKYGDDVADAIGTYGDEAVEVIRDYGDEAVEGFKNGRSPSQIITDLTIEYPITIKINGTNVIINNASDVWNLPGTTRGQAIEELLAQSEYVYWWHCGAEDNGYFPVVDFQKGNTVVSLKTIDPSLESYSNGKGTQKILDYIDALSVDISVDGKEANKILDVRVPKGTVNFLDKVKIEDYAAEHGISKVIMREFK